MTQKIRNLDLAEIAILLDWAAAEGWNPGINDAVAFQSADPTGFFGTFIDGTMVAGIAALAYDELFGFIGLYICHPDWRGKGHGKAVWDEAMAYLGGDRTIGLDGVPEQQANYAAMGFVPAYDTIRMSGTLPARPAGASTISEACFEDIQELDRGCFPSEREPFLRHWLAAPNQSYVCCSEGKPEAYAVRRPCREGAKIGPLFASSIGDASAIMALQSGLVHIDVPTTQPEWLAALSSLGLRPGFKTTRMYRGTPPSLNMSRIFGVSSLELG